MRGHNQSCTVGFWFVGLVVLWFPGFLVSCLCGSWIVRALVGRRDTDRRQRHGMKEKNNTGRQQATPALRDAFFLGGQVKRAYGHTTFLQRQRTTVSIADREGEWNVITTEISGVAAAGPRFADWHPPPCERAQAKFSEDWEARAEDWQSISPRPMPLCGFSCVLRATVGGVDPRAATLSIDAESATRKLPPHIVGTSSGIGGFCCWLPVSEAATPGSSAPKTHVVTCNPIMNRIEPWRRVSE